MTTRHLATVLALLSLVACSSPSEPEPDSTPTPPAQSDSATESVEVTVGHCWIEPVSFQGEDWAAPLRLNYGGSGGAFFDRYRDWQGEGELTLLAPKRAEYRDDGGSVLPFRPTSYLRRVEGGVRLCG